MDGQEIYNSQFHQAYWIEEKQLVISHWQTPLSIGEEVFMQEMINYFNGIKNYQPKSVLIDATQAEYTINPNLQAWMATELFPIYAEIGLKKMALVISPDELTQLSMEQALEEGESLATYQTEYFESVKDAQNWCEEGL